MLSIDRVRYVIKHNNTGKFYSGSQNDKKFRSIDELSDKVNICTYSSEKIARRALCNNYFHYEFKIPLTEVESLIENNIISIIPVYENIQEIADNVDEKFSPIEAKNIMKKIFNPFFTNLDNSPIVKNSILKAKECFPNIDNKDKLLFMDLMFIACSVQELMDEYNKKLLK